jgi:hypothetical protein
MKSIMPGTEHLRAITRGRAIREGAIREVSL